MAKMVVLWRIKDFFQQLKLNYFRIVLCRCTLYLSYHLSLRFYSILISHAIVAINVLLTKQFESHAILLLVLFYVHRDHKQH